MKKLNKKKGFTLVELIVVIAIIGVLAAILIPTLIGYVTRSHVNNANALAGKMRDSVTHFLTQADAEGYGMFMSNSAKCDIEIFVKNDGDWDLTCDDETVFVDHFSTKWKGHGTGRVGDNNATSAVAEDRLASSLAHSFVDFKSGYIKMRLVGGVCTALYVTRDQESAIADFAEFGDKDGWATETYYWDHTNQGMFDNGIVVGTSPVLLYGDGTGKSTDSGNSSGGNENGGNGGSDNG